MRRLAAGRGSRLVFLAAALSLVVAAPVRADDDDHDTARFVVDQDEVQCPNADFNSIQAAVAAAPAGSLILVCPDTYNEDVDVPKTLTLRAVPGAEDDDDDEERRNPSRRCFTSSPPDPRRDAIVTGGIVNFNLRADGIVVEGFVIQAAQEDVRTSPLFSGYKVRGNLIQDTPAFGGGVNLGSNGVKLSKVTGNCLRNHGSFGVGNTLVFTSRARLSNALVAGNRFTGNREGVDFSGLTLPVSDLKVARNRSRQDFRWLEIIQTTDVTIAGNDVRRHEEGAILVGGGNNVDIRIKQNDIADGGSGISANAVFGIGPNTDLVVKGNEVRGSLRDGIRSLPSAIRSSVFVGNLTLDNGESGIRLDSGSDNNRLARNVSLHNARFDCEDNTVGAGTAGTANLWIDNVGETENREATGGICEPEGDDDDDDDDDDEDDDD